MLDSSSRALFHLIARSNILKKLASQVGMRGPASFARRFVAGETIEEAIETARALEARIDRLIEELAARRANLGVTSGGQAIEEAAEALETRGIIVLERGRFRVRERSVLRYYARTIEHLLVTTGRTH